MQNVVVMKDNIFQNLAILLVDSRFQKVLTTKGQEKK